MRLGESNFERWSPTNKRVPLLIIALVSLTLPSAVYHVNATSPSGSVYIDPPKIDPALHPVGSIFNVTVLVAGMPFFDGWDVAVRTNSSVISPVNITFANNLFETNYGITPTQALNCVNNVVKVGTCRAGVDGAGVAHSAAAFLGKPSTITPPIAGTLLVVNYNVTGASGFSRIDIIASTFSNGTATPVPHAVFPAIYGTEPPEFIVSANPASLAVIQGFNITTTITVTSVSGFAGSVSLNASKEFGTIFAETVLNLTASGSNSTQLTFLAPWSIPAQDYPQVSVTASSGFQSRSIFIDVNVKIRDFQLAINPSGLKIHAGNFANTTITLKSQNGFTGNVSLMVQVPANVTYILGSSIISLLPDATVHTSLNISTPIVSLPFSYKINVTGSATLVVSGGVTLQLLHIQQLVVNPPPPSFAISIDPGTIVVRAGLTSSVTINIRSVDYFWQYVYLSATMSGGAASFDINNYYVPLPSSKFANITESVNFTLSVYVPVDQIPGHYIVLLTVYQDPLRQIIGIPVVITSLSPYHAVSNPTILGLSPLLYFGTLGALVIPFVFLSVYTYKKAREDEDEDWES